MIVFIGRTSIMPVAIGAKTPPQGGMPMPDFASATTAGLNPHSGRNTSPRTARMALHPFKIALN
jgi:hypothetical protein